MANSMDIELRRRKVEALLEKIVDEDMSDMSTYKHKLKKARGVDKTTTLRSKCVDCNSCPIEYDISNYSRELCMCTCHDHAAPSRAAEETREQVMGLSRLS